MSTKSGRNNWHRGQPQVKLLQRYNWPVLHIINLIPVVPYESYLGEIPCFRHFVWVRQLADTDCVISIQYDTLQFISYLITCRKIGKSLHDENIPITWLIRFELKSDFPFLTRPRPLAAGPIRNAETWNLS